QAMGKSYQLAVLEALGFKAVAALIATPTPGDTLTGVGRTHNALYTSSCRYNRPRYRILEDEDNSHAIT
ncbi:hypothetical protein ABMX62_05810, partial [Vibrio vulnificus]|uniref:hypothetical protein n=1 Tax=Vibrio vulnificus TaxID=672 RepID=UPI004058DB83